MDIDISKLPNNVFRDDCKRLDVSKLPQYDKDGVYTNGYPEQEIRYKIPHIYAWSSQGSTVNYKDKSFTYTIAANNDNTTEVVFKYEDICKIFGWKSFEFSDDKLRIIPEIA